MQHRGLVCATLLFLVAVLVLPAAPAAAEPGLVRISDVFAGLWGLLDLLGDRATETDNGVPLTRGQLGASLDGSGLTDPTPTDSGDSSLSTGLLDPNEPTTDLKGGFDGDG